MLNKYNELFDIYLRLCKSKYNTDKPYDNLEDCIITCERCLWELSGMLMLLNEVGKITSKKKEEEFQRILENFSTHKLFNAYMEKGEVMVWSK